MTIEEFGGNLSEEELSDLEYIRELPVINTGHCMAVIQQATLNSVAGPSQISNCHNCSGQARKYTDSIQMNEVHYTL